MAKKSAITKSPAKEAPQRAMKPVATASPRSAAKTVAPKLAAKAATKAPAKPAAVTTVTMKHLAVSLAGQHDMSAKQANAVLSGIM